MKAFAYLRVSGKDQMNQNSVEKAIRDLTIEHRELVKRANMHPEEIPDLKIRSAEIFSKVGNMFKFPQESDLSQIK